MPTLEQVAIDAALRAGGLLGKRFRTDLNVQQKGVHDFVTEVDREAEALVLDTIRSAYPEHQIMAEESSPDTTGLAAGHRWIVDPLDGTTNFIHGVPTFAVSVAVEDPDGLAAGAIYDPVHKELFHAARGRGAYLDGKPIKVSGKTDMDASLIATGFPFRSLVRLERYLSAFEQFLRQTAGVRRAGAAAIDLAYTACGRYDGFWEFGLSPWDLAAGVLLVQEAGGVVTDFGGGTDYLGGDVVAASPAIHERMLDITRPVA